MKNEPSFEHHPTDASNQKRIILFKRREKENNIDDCELILDSLANHPSVVKAMEVLHAKEREKQLLMFIDAEQRIFNSQLISQDIPLLESNIQNIKSKVQELHTAVDSISSNIQKQEAAIGQIKLKIGKTYEQYRQAFNQVNEVDKNMNKLRNSRMESNRQGAHRQGAHRQGVHRQGAHQQGAHQQGAHRQGAHQSKSRLSSSKLLESKKQNFQQLNNQPVFSEHSLLLKNIRAKTSNHILENKICELKLAIKQRIKLLEERKAQRSELTQRLNSKLQENRRGKMVGKSSSENADGEYLKISSLR